MREAELLSRITFDPEQCGGRPCIRGMRIRVLDVLELLAAGEVREQILEDYPYLEAEDITASLLYAARQLDHPVLAEKLSALNTPDYLEARADRGSREPFLEVLSRAPNAAPMPGDELDEGPEE